MTTARLLHAKKPLYVAIVSIARTYEEYMPEDNTFWREGEPLYTITDAQLRNIAREIAGDDRKLYAKIYTTMHEELRA